MDTKNDFNAYDYFENLIGRNKLARQNKFKISRITGIRGMEEALFNLKKTNAFFCVDDTSDGVTLINGGSPFNRRVYLVFICLRYKLNDMVSQHNALSVCRKLYRQILSKMLIDKDCLLNEFIYLNTDRISFREFEQFLLNGCTGLYFTFDVDEPTDLTYEPDEWE